MGVEGVLLGLVIGLAACGLVLAKRVRRLGERVGRLGVEQQRHCRMLTEQGERVKKLEVVIRVDPLGAACGPACRTEAIHGSHQRWCETHRRWWAPEGAGS